MAAPVVPNPSCLELTETAIEKDNFGDWVHFHYSKNSFSGKANTKIARDFEPALGEPRCARRATKSMGGTACRPRKSRSNFRKSNLGAFVQPSSNLFYQKFLKNGRFRSAPPPAAAKRRPASQKNFLYIF